MMWKAGYTDASVAEHAPPSVNEAARRGPVPVTKIGATLSMDAPSETLIWITLLAT